MVAPPGTSGFPSGVYKAALGHVLMVIFIVSPSYKQGFENTTSIKHDACDSLTQRLVAHRAYKVSKDNLPTLGLIIFSGSHVNGGKG